ncbi:O-antigen ligase family protein [Thermoleophilum album]|nr:O-antigen ligase family protein [Thermoleophilum album]
MPPRRMPQRMRDQLGALLSANPALPFALVALAVLVWMAVDEGGFRAETYGFAGLVLAVALVFGLLLLPTPAPARGSLLLLLGVSGYAALSLLSALWADEPWTALDGGLRVAVAALACAPLVLWPPAPPIVRTLTLSWVVAVSVVALFELRAAATAAVAFQHFHEGRLAEPVGYTNANVALWTLAGLPALVLSADRSLTPLLRATSAACCVLLISLAALGQSRGWLLALLLMLPLLLLVRELPRLLLFSLPVLLPLAALTPRLLDVYPRYRPSASGATLIDPLIEPLAGAMLVAALLAWAFALVDRRLARAALASPLARLLTAATLVVVLGATVLSATHGKPVEQTRTWWREFTGASQHSNEPAGSRFASGLGQQFRYDYWRVAWSEFRARPLLGHGAENFALAYLRKGRSLETPYFAHSLPLQTLAGTGLVGALLLGGALLSAALTSRRTLRRCHPDLRMTLLALAVGAAYFFLHAAGDWLWEFPTLSATFLVFLALAASQPLEGEDQRAPLNRRVRYLGLVAALLAGLMLTVQWAYDRNLRRGQAIGVADPAASRTLLERAATLNPLAPTPLVALATVELARGDERAAERQLSRALERAPNRPEALLLRGVVRLARGDQSGSRDVARARRLAPRNGAIRIVADAVRRRRPPSPLATLALLREDVARRTNLR